MKTLTIDTATATGLIVLGEGERVICSQTWKLPDRHAESLAINIEKALKKVGWKPSDIEGVGVALGPGSFMGLRIGMATAKGIAAALKLPIAGYESLHTLALGFKDFAGVVVPAIDARRSEVYAAAYDFSKTDPILLRPCAIPPDKLSAVLDDRNGEALLVGDGAALYWDQLKKKSRKKEESAAPRPETVLSIIYNKLKKGGDDINKLVPSYVRLSDAEIGFLGNAGKK